MAEAKILVEKQGKIARVGVGLGTGWEGGARHGEPFHVLLTGSG